MIVSRVAPGLLWSGPKCRLTGPNIELVKCYSGTKGKVDGSHNEHQWLDDASSGGRIVFEEARKGHGDEMPFGLIAMLGSVSPCSTPVYELRGLADLIEEPLPPEDMAVKTLKASCLRRPENRHRGTHGDPVRSAYDADGNRTDG